jgi:DNA-binding NarL/FixJ family response regulator
MDTARSNITDVPAGKRAVPSESGATAMDTALTTVFLVEDSRHILERLTDLLTTISNVAVVGNANTPESAIEGILRTRPDCVVLDIQLVGGSGIDVLRKVHPGEPGIVFIVLTNHADPQYLKVCIENGASYFFDKSSEFQRVKEAIAALGTRH